MSGLGRAPAVFRKHFPRAGPGGEGVSWTASATLTVMSRRARGAYGDRNATPGDTVPESPDLAGRAIPRGTRTMPAPREQATLPGQDNPATGVRRIQMYVGGRWIDSSASLFADVHNPATDQLIARTPLGGAADVDRAVAAATKAYPTWRATPPVNRVKFLFTLKNLLEKNFDDLARICTVEHGKTLDESRSSVRRTIDNVDLACGIPTLMQGRALEDIAAGIDCYTYRQPMGVFAAITPFNFPNMVPMWFLPHAIACGNTFIVKPSERVPLSQVRVFELLHEAGLPEGVVNLVHGAKEAVDAILDHPGIAGVSFVGSSPVAHYIYRRGADKGKRVQALGGAKNFVLVMPDADMDRAAQVSTESCFGCAGERCLANSVVLGVGDAYETIAAKLVAEAKKIRVGDGLEPGVTMGPVISRAHREKVLGYIEKGKAEGGRVVAGGSRADVGGKGWYVHPTVFDGVSPDATIAREEIFGPVLAVLPFDEPEEAVRIANASPYGLAAAVWTKDLKRGLTVARRLQAGTVWVNSYNSYDPALPFGGYKMSGFGRDQGAAALEGYTHVKSVWVDLR